MKKFLLSLATLALAATTAMATDVTVTMANCSITASGLEFSFTTGTTPDFTFTCKKNSGSTSPTYNTNGKDLRIYAKGTLTIAAPEGVTLEAISFNISTAGKKRLTTITASEGTMTQNGTPTFVTDWAGSTNSVTFTVGDYTTLGTDKGTEQKPTAGQLDFDAVTITYSETASDKEHAGLQFPESSYTAILGQAFTAPTLTKATNAAVTYSSSDTNVATVNATTGEVTLVGAGTTTIKAEAPENDTYTAGSAQYTLTVVKGYNTLAEYLAACGNKNDEGYINFPLTVTYVIGGNTYVIDEAGTAGLIFKYDLGYEVGNIIPAGWTAQTDNFYGLIELKPVSTMPASTENSGVTYSEVSSIDESMVNEVVVLKNVTFAAETPDTKTNFSGTTPDGTEYTFRNNFTIASTAAGIYDVKVAVANFKGALQLYPLEYQQAVSDVPVISGTELNDENQFASTSTVTITAAEGATIYYRTNTEADFQVYNAPFTINATTSIYAYAVEEGKQQSREVSVTYYYNPSLGIDGIEVENGAAEYYNMQGVRVANPENGMYIRVQNGKAQKVIIK